MVACRLVLESLAPVSSSSIAKILRQTISTPRKLLEYLAENYSAFSEPMLLEIGIHNQIKETVGDVFAEKVIRNVLGK